LRFQEADDQSTLVRRNLSIGNLPVHGCDGARKVIGLGNFRQVELQLGTLSDRSHAVEDRSGSNGIAALSLFGHGLHDVGGLSLTN
jgi:hypothetical protein